MIGSLWRYSHFVFAIVSSLFLIIASITGAILTFEPIVQHSQRYAPIDLKNVSLSETITALKQNYNEVLEIEVTSEDFLKASVVTKGGLSQTIYVHPTTGKKLGNVTAQSPFFSFITNLHRSLFLKSIGRGFVGVISFLLCFIAVTGIFLLAQRQGGFSKWFTKVKEASFTQRYHVILGRWLFAPILIIAITGVYLSAKKFALLPKNFIEHDWSAISSKDLTTQIASDSELFQKTTLSEIRKLTFPFSDDPEDYFQLALKDKELLVHQYSSKIVSEVPYPFVELTSRLSMQLHTGQGSIIWSIILLVTSLSLLFFMFSGFAMSLKRRKRTKLITTTYSKDEAAYILLVGSESGSTYAFAKAFYNSLKNQGKKVFVATLNEYSTYKKATHIIVFTATYGDGDAPSNARKFEKRFATIKPNGPLYFSVVGFGSLMYPKYCQFALKIDAIFHGHSYFTPINPLEKINNQSQADFKKWTKNWNAATRMNVTVNLPNFTVKNIKQQDFVVIEKTPLNADNIILLRLRPQKKVRFESGDLLNIIPPNDEGMRPYSIARIDNDIVLSIKRHTHGICSKYLCTLNIGESLKAHIKINPTFHFPQKAPSVWLVSNGTGIAPYLGMLQETPKMQVTVTWGGKTETSFDYYRKVLDSHKSRKQKIKYQLALSQTKKKEYVQNLLFKQKEEVAKTLKQGGVIMVCGSMEMQHSVLDILEQITTTQLEKPLSDFESNGQILMDCY